MSIFSFLGGWFKKQGASVEKLFSRIEPLVAKAEPIVKDITAVVATVGVLDPALAPAAGVLTAIGGYLNKAVGDAAVVDTFLKANETAPVNSLLHNAAALALKYTHGTWASTAVSDIDTAVQVAYSVVKEAAPAAAPLAPMVQG